MPQRSRRSKSARKTTVRLPGGRYSTSYGRRRAGKARCRICGGVLHGTTSAMPSGLPRSSRGPSRSYGGNICGSCLRSLLVARVRGSA